MEFILVIVVVAIFVLLFWLIYKKFMYKPSLQKLYTDLRMKSAREMSKNLAANRKKERKKEKAKKQKLLSTFRG